MTQAPASGHIRAARANLRLATQICGNADLTHLQRALNLLETTASEIRMAETALRSGLRNEQSEVQLEAAQLKREVACMMRVVDGCSALHRGRAVRLGCTPLTYSPRGQAAAATASPSAAYEMQG